MSLCLKHGFKSLALGIGLLASPAFALDVTSLTEKKPLVEGSKEEAAVCAAVIAYTIYQLEEGPPSATDLNPEEKAKIDNILIAWIMEAADLNGINEQAYLADYLASDADDASELSFKARKFYLEPCVARGVTVAAGLGLDLTKPRSKPKPTAQP